jgi:hypothetical protein
MRGPLRALIAGALFAALGAAPAERATLTLVNAAGAPIAGPLTVEPPTREYPVGGIAIRVMISPRPAVAPQVSFVSDRPDIVDVGMHPREPVIPDAGPLGTAMYFVSRGRATVSARVGPPYDVTLRVPVDAFFNTNLACAIGGNAALAFDASGTPLLARTPADADVYLTVRGTAGGHSWCEPFTVLDQPVLRVVHFPYGGVRIREPLSFAAVRASQWRDEVREANWDAAPGSIWLVRAKSGATMKFIGPYGPLDVASAGADFPPRTAAEPVLSVTKTIPAGPHAPSLAVTLVPDPGNALFGASSSPSEPLIVGYANRNRFFDLVFGAQLLAEASPEPYDSRPPVWTATEPLTVSTFGSRVVVTANGIGVGTVTARFTGAAAGAASRRVHAYGTIAIGCSDVTDGFGVAFGDDGIARAVSAPSAADLFASSDPGTFRCAFDPHAMPTPFTPGATPAPFTPGGLRPPSPTAEPRDAGGWYFPYGGVFFPDGVDYTAVTPRMWRRERTTVSSAEILATARRVGRPRSVLLIRTRSGRLVKLLWLPRGPLSFVGLYAVSRADGTFAY